MQSLTSLLLVSPCDILALQDYKLLTEENHGVSDASVHVCIVCCLQYLGQWRWKILEFRGARCTTPLQSQNCDAANQIKSISAKYGKDFLVSVGVAEVNPNCNAMHP